MRMLQREISFENDAIPSETFLFDQAHFNAEGNHKPLKKKKMKKIPVMKVNDKMLKTDCSICYMEFKEGNGI